MWYSNTIGLNPDIIIFGKKSQISGIMTNNKYAEAIDSKYRKLEVTFDGDLIDAVRAEFILKAIKKYALLENIKKKSIIIRDELSSMFENYRSEGYLIAFDFKNSKERDNFVINAYSNHLLVNPTNEKSIRMRPNLAFSDDEISDMLLRIKKSRN
jgi:L-lysine 6-transaminase